MSPEEQPSISGPCSGFEPEVADRVEAVMPTEGITPGTRVCHDAQPGHLRVDFVYSRAQPRPLALEVTAIVAPEDESGTEAANAMERRLTETAEEEGLGAWFVAVEMNRDMRLLEPEILKIIRNPQPTREALLANRGSIRPGDYRPDELMRVPREQLGSFIAERESFRELGLKTVTPVTLEGENFVGVLPGRGATIREFDAELQERINAKADVLGKAANLQRHLAVFVQRWDVSGDPASMPVPELPPTIDVLWVVHRWNLVREQKEIWVTRRSQSAWNDYAKA